VSWPDIRLCRGTRLIRTVIGSFGMKSTLSLLLIGLLTLLPGCRIVEHLPGNLYVAKDRTTYRTPDMRLDAIREIGNRSDGTDSPQQQAFVNQLAAQIQVEPDPLIRQQIVLSVGEFRTPLAQQVVLAALDDSAAIVRQASCDTLGKRGDEAAIEPLAGTLASDDSIDVRLAATAALGKFKSQQAARALTAALADSDPAMQYAGVQAMKNITGQDYGPDVETWLAVAQGESPKSAPEVSVASRPRGWLPF
jgi:hypothetical protein